eukprot:1048497-Prorocentrum_minimum.AAC.1
MTESGKPRVYALGIEPRGLWLYARSMKTSPYWDGTSFFIPEGSPDLYFDHRLHEGWGSKGSSKEYKFRVSGKKSQ